ncbi:MAG: DUF1427 family protein [Akkermansiaceae bacterium]|nr:DUF1427 family protein [Armatimonadota bacterium]
MIPNLLGLFLGLCIGIGCRRFDIPLPGPPNLIGALVVLFVTLGYMGTDYLLAHQAKTTRRTAQAVTKDHPMLARKSKRYVMRRF